MKRRKDTSDLRQLSRSLEQVAWTLLAATNVLIEQEQKRQDQKEPAPARP